MSHPYRKCNCDIRDDRTMKCVIERPSWGQHADGAMVCDLAEEVLRLRAELAKRAECPHCVRCGAPYAGSNCSRRFDPAVLCQGGRSEGVPLNRVGPKQ